MCDGTSRTNYLDNITTALTMYIMFILVEHFDVKLVSRESSMQLRTVIVGEK